ncbi:hypothetical protein SUGI_0918830 [Cryptomeria japonica]|nr:hypothetical protein SUGI_0918830 [Cryptomeria japonica]
MVVFAGGDLLPQATDPILDPMMVTLSITSFPGPMAVPPSDLVLPQIDGSSLESSMATPMVFDSDTIPDMSVFLTMEPQAINVNLKGWKNMLVGNTKTVDPNFIPVYSQSEDEMSSEFPNIVLDHILLNMANNLLGKFFSLRPMVEMVRKWVKDIWKLKGSVSVSAMPGALFLFKFTTEKDVTLVLSVC